jgi:hypothetical protein
MPYTTLYAVKYVKTLHDAMDETHETEITASMYFTVRN